MGGRKWLVLWFLVAAAGPAWGQSEEQVMAAAGQQVRAYTECLRTRIAEMAKADMAATEKQVIARANLACGKERDALWKQYQKAPLNMPPAEATRQLDEALEYAEPDLKAMIQKARAS